MEKWYSNRIGGMNRSRQHIDAFTIFEVTVVLAIMGVIIGLIATSVNRFQEQLKMTGDINQELNDWFAFRANLWNELYQCDSIQQHEQELYLFSNDRLIKYKLDGDELLRSNGNNWMATKTKAESIRLERNDEKTNVIFDFLWKGENMTLNYYFEPDIKSKINTHFAKLK